MISETDAEGNLDALLGRMGWHKMRPGFESGKHKIIYLENLK